MVLRLSTFPADVRSVVLAGLVTTSSAVINAADSVLSALGKVQAQVSGALDGTGRNKFHNPLFNIQQRGQGPWTTSGVYGPDRWLISFVGDTASFSLVGLSDTDRAAIGDEEAANALQCVFTGASASADYTQVVQRIENARRLSGKTVIVSFWAKCASGTLKFGANLIQYFGSGGSPSAAIGINGVSVTISTTWTRYSISLAVPSATGKTFGTNGDSSTQLDLWYSSASGNAAGSGSVGVQSGTVTLWGVQLEIGATATPLEKPEPGVDLNNCLRFYQAAGQIYWQGQITSGVSFATAISYPVPMRTVPTMILNGNFSSGFGTPTLAANAALLYVVATAAGTGPGAINITYSAVADL